jgi:hypothetical protein
VGPLDQGYLPDGLLTAPPLVPGSRWGPWTRATGRVLTTPPWFLVPGGALGPGLLAGWPPNCTPMVPGSRWGPWTRATGWMAS